MRGSRQCVSVCLVRNCVATHEIGTIANVQWLLAGIVHHFVSVISHFIERSRKPSRMY